MTTSTRSAYSPPQRVPRNKLVVVSSIIMIIGALAGFVLFQMILSDAQTGRNHVEMPSAGVIVMAYTVLAVQFLGAGIGIAWSNRPDRAKTLMIAGGILIGIKVIDIVVAMSGGTGNAMVVIGLLWPILYLTGARRLADS